MSWFHLPSLAGKDHAAGRLNAHAFSVDGGNPRAQQPAAAAAAAMAADRPGRSAPGFDLRLVALIAAYLTLNSSLNLLNKWALSNFFEYPLLLTSFHMLFSFTVLLPVMLSHGYRELHAAAIQRQWKGFACIGVFMAVNIALNNLSLVLISLSLNQVIRSAIPVATAILAVFIEGKTPTRGEFGSLLVLTAGVMLTVFEGLKGSVLGISFAVAGMLSNAAMMSVSGRVMSEKVDVVRLTFYTAPVSCATLLPFVLWREAARFQQYLLTDSKTAIGILLVTSANALLYNVVHNAMIKMTSAVTTTVIGEAKIVGLLVLSALLLGESREFTLKMSVGCATAMIGFIAFSHCKMANQQVKSSAGRTDAAANSRPEPAGNGIHDVEKQPMLSPRGRQHSGELNGFSPPNRRPSKG